MCGRYGFGNPARLSTLPLGVDLPALAARFNVAPSQAVPIVFHDAAGRHAILARWGLVPFWADDPAIGNRLANARGETVASKPSFRGAFKARRALLPADRFYEWQPLPGQKVKQPWCIQLEDAAPFCFAGLWERWVPKGQPDAEPLLSCCLVTTEPNAVMAPIHDRMPAIVPPTAYDLWLDPGTPAAAAQALIRPYGGPMRAYPVSTYVNAPRNEGPACSAPLS
ncbi:MAG: SOS response-associated peptidase [Gemmatimonas sp.]|uniref:SOS response-associated peptidase n=1 Tax=Gemmatimonas sp. TaxID=1962908 RepID=UPI0022BD0F0F|nr:SOS response-associated peptidase [Gemmatimonas sp.]MCZ8012696.1 SOS response-associated peptidase [Gemmatimonas sp.]MCZ8268149.1 SOS response-associated peptidase [Gemmatimonas sp.]